MLDFLEDICCCLEFHVVVVVFVATDYSATAADTPDSDSDTLADMGDQLSL